ncbi:hypothetical protein [Halorussus lipolyticus]|uniref:hypothetical protein n=1 Tax=Halorussus lipolyticus TaxID=3034024 RepID=UPI0023E8007E|nr:hypothetical protein [Halorussus sp. DT80]
MSESATPNEFAPTDSDETDGFFGLVAGLYAATLLAPAVAILTAFVTDDAAAPFFGFLGSVVAFAGLVGWYARPKSVAVRLGRSRWIWLAVVAPFGYAGVLFLTISAGLGGAGVGASMVGMIAGMFVGMGFAVAARNRYAKAALDGADEYVRFSARAPKRDRRVHYVVLGAGVVVTFAGPVVAWLTDLHVAENTFYLVGPFLGGLAGLTAERTFAVTDAGLLVDQRVSKNLRPWDQFESFSVSDDAVVVRRAGRSLFGLRDVRRDASDIEDPDAVADALSEFLPREE